MEEMKTGGEPEFQTPEAQALGEPETPEIRPQPTDEAQEPDQGAPWTEPEEEKPLPFADGPYSRRGPVGPPPFVNGPGAFGGSAPLPPPTPKQKPQKPRVSGWTVFLSLLVALALVVGSTAATVGFMNLRMNALKKEAKAQTTQLQNQIKALEEEVKSNSFTGQGNSVSGTPNQNGDGLTPGQLYVQCVSSVVAVTAQSGNGVSYGSGFLISEDGYVVSNYHVVDGGSRFTVITHDGTEYAAELVGQVSSNDISLLKIEATGLSYARLGHSDDLIVGDQVVAIGNPLGELTSTLTVGYISAKDRTVTTDGSLLNMLQTDAAINSGNSGGPLFNMKGEVVGITTAKYSGTTSSGASIEGIGFAIPVDDVAPMIADLKEHGYVTGAYLGVMVASVDPAVASAYGMPLGAHVQSVEPGYCAEEAGIQPKDIITALGGNSIENLNDLTRALLQFKAGDTTTITVWRAGTMMELNITLSEKPKPQS